MVFGELRDHEDVVLKGALPQIRPERLPNFVGPIGEHGPESTELLNTPREGSGAP